MKSRESLVQIIEAMANGYRRYHAHRTEGK
jgi:hypothetical protein